WETGAGSLPAGERNARRVRAGNQSRPQSSPLSSIRGLDSVWRRGVISTSNPIILYDGICGLCNRLNQFVLKRDRNDRFRFAALQSEFAGKVLERHGVSPQVLDTM